jgi:hypothetical protein
MAPIGRVLNIIIYNNAKGQIVHLENDIALGANKSVQTIIIITTGTINNYLS